MGRNNIELPRDELSSAIRDLRGNEAFIRFVKALSKQTLYMPVHSETSDQAMRFEGERAIVIYINNLLEISNNE